MSTEPSVQGNRVYWRRWIKFPVTEPEDLREEDDLDEYIGTNTLVTPARAIAGWSVGAEHPSSYSGAYTSGEVRRAPEPIAYGYNGFQSYTGLIELFNETPRSSLPCKDLLLWSTLSWGWIAFPAGSDEEFVSEFRMTVWCINLRVALEASCTQEAISEALNAGIVKSRRRIYDYRDDELAAIVVWYIDNTTAAQQDTRKRGTTARVANLASKSRGNLVCSTIAKQYLTDITYGKRKGIPGKGG